MMAPRRRRRRRWLEMMALSSVLVVAAPSMASTASRVSRSGAHIDLVRAARATLLVAPVAVSAPWTSATARRISSSRLRARRRRHRSSICDELSMAMTACRSPAAASMVVLSPPPAPPPRRRLPPYTVLLDIAFSGAEFSTRQCGGQVCSTAMWTSTSTSQPTCMPRQADAHANTSNSNGSWPWGNFHRGIEVNGKVS